jgi:O-antigen/teichoic acid export membrane protein
MVYLGFEVYGAIVGLILSVFIAVLVAGYFSRGPSIDGRFEYGVLVKFAIPVSLFFIAVAVLMHIDILFAKSMISDNHKIGLYTSAQALSRVIYFVFTAFSVVLLPSISTAIADKNMDLVKAYISRSLRYMVLLLSPICLIVSATSRQLIALLYSPDYIQAGPPLNLLVFGISFLSITLALSTILQGYGVPNAPLIIVTGLIPLDFLLLYVLIPRYDLLGAALATLVTCFIGLVVSAAYVYMKFNTLLGAASSFRIVLASLIVYLVARALPPPTYLLPAYYPGCFALYLILLLVLGEVNEQDRTFAREFFQRFLRKRAHNSG